MMLWWTYQQLRASNVKTRLAVIAKLAESGNLDSVEPLLFALKDKSPEVRTAATVALEKIQDKKIIESLLQKLRDPSPTVRAAVAEILGKRNEIQAVTPMTALLQDADATVRAAVSRSLERLGWKPNNDSQRVQQILASGNIRQMVALGSKAIGPLVDIMRNGAPDKQVVAIKALAEINDPRVSMAMQEALKKSDPALRTLALGILERLCDPGAYESIEPMLRDGSATVRAAAVEAAARCGGKRAASSLIRLLKDHSWEVRHTTVKALGLIEDPAAVDALCAMLSDPDRDVREITIISLGKIQDERAIPFLVPLLFDAESVLRAASAASLRQINRQWEKHESILKILPRIKEALDHPDYWVKHSAVKLLEQLSIDPSEITLEEETSETPATPQEHPAFSILADLLFDFDRDMRLAAAEALGRLREKGAQPILAAAAHDADRLVQQAAQMALVAIS